MTDSVHPSISARAEPIVVHVDPSFEPLVPKFLVNRKKELTSMAEAVAQHDFDSVRKVAHGMKGVSGSYGFPDMTTMAARIEQAAKTQDAETIRTDLTALTTYLERVEVVYD